MAAHRPGHQERPGSRTHYQTGLDALGQPARRCPPYCSAHLGCIDIFTVRGKHAWPPAVTVYESWREPFTALARENGFTPEDIDEAAAELSALVNVIDAAVLIRLEPDAIAVPIPDLTTRDPSARGWHSVVVPWDGIDNDDGG